MNKLIPSILFFLSCCCFATGQHSHIHFIEKPDSQKISIYIDQTLFTEFLYSDTLYKQVLYPIYTASGTEITRGYPIRPKADERTDHPHQVGLWFSFGDINGLDFWNNSNRIPHDKKEHYGIIRFTGIKNINEKENKFGIIHFGLATYLYRMNTFYWIAGVKNTLLFLFVDRLYSKYLMILSLLYQIFDACFL